MTRLVAPLMRPLMRRHLRQMERGLKRCLEDAGAAPGAGGPHARGAV